MDVEKVYDSTVTDWSKHAPEEQGDIHVFKLQAVARAAAKDMQERCAKVCEIASNVGPGAKIDKRIKACEIAIRAMNWSAND